MVGCCVRKVLYRPESRHAACSMRHVARADEAVLRILVQPSHSPQGLASCLRLLRSRVLDLLQQPQAAHGFKRFC